MNARLLLVFIVMAFTRSFAQPGLYGPATDHLKAGDVAPELTFTKILNVPLTASGTSSQSGKLTVIAFFSDTTHNLEAVSRWNALVDEFSGKSVRFVWITGESESTLLPWLNQHPVKGWVYHDPKGATGHAYGLEWADSVLVGEDRRILGFSTMLPSAAVVNAGLEGRITTTRPTQATMRAFMESHRILLDSEPFRMPPINADRPDFPPSHVLHVSASQGEESKNSTGDDFWVLKGYALKDAIALIYAVHPIRVQLPAALDDDLRYDFALVVPTAERDQLRDRFRQGLEDHFHVKSTLETRSHDVYVMTARGRTPPVVQGRDKASAEVASATVGSLDFVIAGGSDETVAPPKSVSLAAIRGVRTEGTIDALCSFLESQLDRPVINETNLEGEFDFDIKSSGGAQNDFLDHLREQTGLAIVPAQRSIEVLVFRPR